jgi:hypothetical protein
MHRLHIPSVVLAISCLMAPVAMATTVAQMTLRDMVSMAPSIVVGTVESSSSRWNEDHSLIVTDVRIQVTDVIKGQNVGQVVITQPGGRVGKLRVDVDGAVAYRSGQETVLFLAPDARGHQQVLGVFRGRFDVATNAQTGKKSVQGLKVADVDALTGASKPGVQIEGNAPPERTMDLDSFVSGLKGMVQSPKGGK